MTSKVALKDQLFHPGNVARVAAELAAVDPRFDAPRFTAEVLARFGELELKQRIAWITSCLGDHLPGDYRTAVDILLGSLPPPCDPALRDGDFGDFIYAPYSLFVARHGCNDADLGFSLAALAEITTRFSAEDAIRPFLSAYPDETLAVMAEWCRHPHYHVRRLCSEGSRPRLPWSARLPLPVSTATPILDVLHADDARYVTRSVANHVNDIGKDDPDLAVDLLESWRARGRQRPGELDYIVRHGTRALVKKGHPRALALIGASVGATVEVADLRYSSTVELGSDLEFGFTVTTPKDADLIIDYVIGFASPSGRVGRKTYKLTRLRTAANTPSTIRHRHPLRPGMSTRRIIPGKHLLEVQINGTSQFDVMFDVTPPTGQPSR